MWVTENSTKHRVLFPTTGDVFMCTVEQIQSIIWSQTQHRLYQTKDGVLTNGIHKPIGG
jgi:hypothetical protein